MSIRRNPPFGTRATPPSFGSKGFRPFPVTSRTGPMAHAKKVVSRMFRMFISKQYVNPGGGILDTPTATDDCEAACKQWTNPPQNEDRNSELGIKILQGIATNIWKQEFADAMQEEVKLHPCASNRLNNIVHEQKIDMANLGKTYSIEGGEVKPICSSKYGNYNGDDPCCKEIQGIAQIKATQGTNNMCNPHPGDSVPSSIGQPGYEESAPHSESGPPEFSGGGGTTIYCSLCIQGNCDALCEFLCWWLKENTPGGLAAGGFGAGPGGTTPGIPFN